MKIFKLFIPGAFEDAYMYNGQLLIFTEDRTLRFYGLEEMAANLQSRYPNLASMLEYMLVDNKRLKRSYLHKRLEHAPFKKQLRNAVAHYPDDGIEFESDAIRSHEFKLDIGDFVPLTLLVYYSRLYIGGSTGLFSVDVDWPGAELAGKPSKRHDVETIALSAYLGTVNISSGFDGLFSTYDEFNTLGHRERDEKATPRLVADESLRTSWASDYLFNYPVTKKAPTVFRSISSEQEKSKSKRTVEFDEDESTTYQVSYLLVEERADIEFAYNFGTHVFTQTDAGDIMEGRVNLPKNKENTEDMLEHLPMRFSTEAGPQLKERSSRPEKIGRILSAWKTSEGIVFETYDRVLLADNPQIVIVEAPALAVRSFTDSKRYRNMVVVTTEEGVHISSLFDDSILDEEAQ